MELSPIALSRESFGGKAHGSADSNPSPTNEEHDVVKIVPNEQQPESAEIATVMESGKLTTGSPSWYLGSHPEATPPLSNTSSEFSLESLSDNDGIPDENSKEGFGETGDQHEQLKLPAGGDVASSEVDPKIEIVEDHPVEQKMDDDNQGEQAKDSTTTTNDHQESEASVDQECSSQSADQQTMSSVELEEKSAVKLNLSASKQEAVEEDNENVTDETPETSHTSSTHGEEQEQTSPDADALIQDATEKVKKFIYELSILNASEQDADTSSSENSPRNESSTSVSSNDDATKEMSKDNDHDNDNGVLGDGESSVDNVDTERDAGQEKEAASYESLEVSGSHIENGCESQLDSKRLSDASTLSNTVVSDARIWQSPPRRQSTDMSFGTPGTPRTPGGNHDYTEAKKELGATSLEFIQRLRGAAQKRKQNLTRSRDSLVAKEREQREAVAALKVVPKQKPPTPNVQSLAKETTSKTIANSFKAKPLPATNGELGSGGLKGIPKVAKKPTTVAASPLLGARRVNPPKVKSLQAPVTKPRIVNKDDSLVPKTKKMHPVNNNTGTFKARPAPPTTGALGRSGQFGVPKIPKRPVTVPSSPCLGPRRRHSSIVPGKENQKQTRRLSTGMVKSTPSHQPAVSKASSMVSPIF